MVGIIVAVGVTIPLALLGWLLMQARAQHHRIGTRIDDLATRFTEQSETRRERSQLLDALKGDRAPGFSLPDLEGARVSLDALLSPTRPLMLVFVEPRCGPCYELLPDLGGWQRVYGDRLNIVLISAGDAHTNHAMTAEYGITPVLLQHEMDLVLAYNLAQAPAAILIQADGTISAGPRYGTRAIRQLVADTLGMTLPPAPERSQTVAHPGDMAPALHLPDLHGNVIDLETYRGALTLLLFWSPGCSHCRELLPEILAYERHPDRPPIVILSRGPIALNQEMGFTSPVVIDETSTIGAALGVTGTPAAIVIDGRGRVASPVGRGTGGVRALIAAIPSPAVVSRSTE